MKLSMNQSVAVASQWEQSINSALHHQLDKEAESRMVELVQTVKCLLASCGDRASQYRTTFEPELAAQQLRMASVETE